MQTIKLTVPGASGVAFGGPNHDILFVLAARSIVNVNTAEPGSIVTNGNSLYAIRRLGVRGFRSTRLHIL